LEFSLMEIVRMFAKSTMASSRFAIILVVSATNQHRKQRRGEVK